MAAIAMLVAACGANGDPASAQPSHPAASPAPFTLTLSNTTPLVFGMDVDAAAEALGTPLHHVRGKPGDEVLLAIRGYGGAGLLPRRDRLYLQFRGGRLTGWKGDWGRDWMWR